MRLENYIVEEEQGLDYYIPKIQSECKPFLKDIKGAAGTLFRDDTKNRSKPVWKKTVRKNRKPLDTPVALHNALDDLFKEKFGWPARSQGLFCWSLKFTSERITNNWMVFPVGNYKYIWSDKVDDLWEVLGGHYKETPSFIESTVKAFKDNFLDSYKDKNIKMSMKWQGEIMVKCDYAYLVKPELMEPVNEMLGLNWQGAVYKGRKF